LWASDGFPSARLRGRAEVYERICQATCDLVVATHAEACLGRLTFVEQNSEDATYTCSRRPADGIINWSAPTHAIFNQIRGLAAPFPGAFTYFNGRKLAVWKASPVQNAAAYAGRSPGRVIAVNREAGSVDVLTGDGILRLVEVAWNGSPPKAAAEIVRSVRDALGIDVTELMARLDLIEQKVHSSRVGSEDS
jgi:methionyl-tRNA formyltransferase